MLDHVLGVVGGAQPRKRGFNLNLAATAEPPRQYRHGESLDDLKARVDPLDIIEQLTQARFVAKGGEHDALCPFCQKPSDRDLKFRVFAHGGFNCVKCGAKGGSIIDFVMQWIPCDFAAAVSRLRDIAGGAPSDPEEIKRNREKARKRVAIAAKRAAEKRDKQITDAHELWASASPDLPAEAVAYFARRGLGVPAHGSLRWAKAEGAILAPVRDPAGSLIGLSRIYVEPNAKGKTVRLFMGKVGGGFVPLGAEPAGHVAYVEGVEDGLALIQMGAEVSVRCALSADGLTVQTLPSGVTAVAIYADRDKPEPEAGRPNGIGIDRAERAAERFASEGARVSIFVADRPGLKDANDVLRAGAGFRIWRVVEPAQDGPARAQGEAQDAQEGVGGPDVAPEAAGDPDAYMAAWNAEALKRHEESAESESEYLTDDDTGRSLVLAAFTRSMLSSAAALEDGKEQLGRMMADALSRPDGKPVIQLARVTTGLGKTESVIQAIVEHGPRGLVVAFPTIDMAEQFKARALAAHEAAGKTPPPIIVYRGRTQEVPGADKGGDRMCGKPKLLVERVQKSGANAYKSKSLCDRPEPWADFGCQLWEFCQYVKQREEIARAGTDAILVITHAHLFLNLSLPAGFEVETVIVDEKPPMTQEEQIEPDAVTDARMWGGRVSWVAEAVAAAAQEKGRMAAAIREAGVGRTDLEAAAEALDELHLGVQATVASADHGAPLKAALDAADKSRHRQVAALFRGLALELGDGHEDTQANRLEMVRKEGAERQMFVARRTKHMKWFNPDGMSLVMLDATADRGLVERWIGRPVKYVECHAPLKGTVVQVTTATYSKYGLIGRKEAESNMSALASDVRLIYRLHGGSLFVDASKAIIDVLRPLVEAECPGITWMWFQGDRGSDKAKPCRAGIVIGRELPDVSDIEGEARCFVAGTGREFIPAPIGRGGRPDLVKAERERLMRDRSTVWAETTAHPDPIAQAVLESIREASVVQAIGRLRMAREEGKTLYLFGSLPVPIEVDRLVERHELQNALPIAADAAEAVRTAGFHLVDSAKWARDAYRVAPLMGLVADLVGAVGNSHAHDKDDSIMCVGVSAVEVGLRAGKRGPARKAWLLTRLLAEEAVAAARAAGHNVVDAPTAKPAKSADVEPVAVEPVIERRTGAGGNIKLTLVAKGQGRKVQEWPVPLVGVVAGASRLRRPGAPTSPL